MKKILKGSLHRYMWRLKRFKFHYGKSPDVFKFIAASYNNIKVAAIRFPYITRVGTLIVATIYLQLIQNRYMFRSFTVLHCSHQHCVQPVASDVEVVGYL